MSNRIGNRLIFSKSPGKNQSSLEKIHMSTIVLNNKKNKKNKALKYPLDNENKKHSDNDYTFFNIDHSLLNKSNSSHEFSESAPKNSFIGNSDADHKEPSRDSSPPKAVLYRIKHPLAKNVLLPTLKATNDNPKSEFRTVYNHNDTTKSHSGLNLHMNNFKMASLIQQEYRNPTLSNDRKTTTILQNNDRMLSTEGRNTQSEFRSTSTSKKIREQIKVNNIQSQIFLKIEHHKFNSNNLSTSIDDEITLSNKRILDFCAGKNFSERSQTPNRTNLNNNKRKYHVVNNKFEINEVKEKLENSASIPPLDQRSNNITQIVSSISPKKLPAILVNAPHLPMARASHKILTKRNSESDSNTKLIPHAPKTDRSSKKDVSPAYTSREYSMSYRKDPYLQDCIKPILHANQRKIAYNFDLITNRRLLPNR